MSSKASWQFPLRNGGIDFVQDHSSAHFSDDPIPKLVREIIQNSLDARESGTSDPVVVKFTDTEVDRALIGASQLYKHLTACLDRAKAEGMPQPVRRIYENARKALKRERIRCLRVTDSGTTGLSDSKWDALVIQEGAVRKSDLGSPGGSYGVGKNAVFNLSDAQAVFYSTRYVNGREGRVEKMQGKATLMSHKSPLRKGQDVQHIGFYKDSNGEPLFTRQIPDFFRLDETGTGVFIMGFNPRSSDWIDEVTTAVIENFFYAVHHKQLIVEISADFDNVEITHETIDQLFEAKSPQDPNAYYYYKAIRDEKAEQTEGIDEIGILDVYVLTGSGPRRTAYVNRNGMLITDSREQKMNPIAPRGKSLWPDYATVVSPTTDEGDTWIRTMENPSHDSVSPGQLIERKKQRQAERIFGKSRRVVREIIDKKAEINRFGDTSNLQELAEYFPELDPEAQGNRNLQIDIVTTSISQPESQDVDDQNTDDGESNELQQGGSLEGTNSNGGVTNGTDGGRNTGEAGNIISVTSNRTKKKSSRRPKIKKQRFIPSRNTEAIIAFDPTGDMLDEINLKLAPAGGERDNEERIQIIEAAVLSPNNQEVDLDNGNLKLTPNTNERIQLKIVTDIEIDGYALKIG